MRVLNKFVVGSFSLLMSVGFYSQSHAAGMVPETSVVLVSVADGEGVINVTNTDTKAALLYTSLENLPEDEKSLLVVTPPVARVEGGEKQLVRFIVQSDEPITTQRMKRVTFEGIPQKDPNAPSVIGVTVRQNLAVLITPADLPMKSDPWTLLKWSVEGQTVKVHNDSRYVVRLNQQFTLLPSNTNVVMPRPYVLPGQSFSFDAPASALATDASVRIYPASTYGYSVKPYDAPLTKQ